MPGSFIGFGRLGTDACGEFRARTVRPGTVPGPDGTVQAPHLNVHVFARGLLDQLWTRIYLADEPGNDTDPVLAAVPAERRHTLLAQPESAGASAGTDGPVRYRFDIQLQGDQETVFFAT